jgi:hypothetical protein
MILCVCARARVCVHVEGGGQLIGNVIDSLACREDVLLVGDGGVDGRSMGAHLT